MAREPLLMGSLSTVGLHILTSLVQLLLENFNYLFYKTSYLNKDVNCGEPSPSVSLPLLDPRPLIVIGQNPNLTLKCQAMLKDKRSSLTPMSINGGREKSF